MDTAGVAAVFAQIKRELWVVTAAAEQCRGGLIASFVNQASIAPEYPRVLVGLAKHHHTWQLIESSGAFALHLLGQEHLDWVWRFGAQSSRDVDKFERLDCRTAKTGSPILSAAQAWFDCRVEATLDSGDRTIYLAEILEAQHAAVIAPLTAQRFFQFASPETARVLKEQYAADGALDAVAIREWRQQRRGNPASTA